MQDNTNVTPMRDIIERYYQALLPQLATQAERAALDAFYQRIKLAEDVDAVNEAYITLRDQFASQAERDAVGSLCQGICSYCERYGYDNYDDYDYGDPDSILPDWPYNEDGSVVRGYNADGSIAEPLPDEFFLHGTSYVVLPPAEDDALTAVATVIRELSAEDCGVIAPLVETLGVNGYNPTDDELDEASASADIAKWEWRMYKNISATLLDALYELAHDTSDNDGVAELCFCINQAHDYEFLRTLHSSGLALKFEQALAQAAEHVAAE